MSNIKQLLIYKGIFLLGKKNQKKFYFFIFLFFISMLIETAGIGIVIPILNLLTQDNFHLKINNLIPIIDFAKYTNRELILYFIVSMLIIFTLRGLFLSLVSYLQSNYLANIRSDTSDKVFKIYLKKTFPFHLENNSATLVRNINDIMGYTVFVRNSLFLLIEIITFIGVGILLLLYDPLVSILSISIIGILGVIFHRYIQKKSKIWGEQRRAAQEKRLLYLQQGFGSIKDIKMYGREDFFINKFSFFNQTSANTEYNYVFTMSLPRYYFEWLTILGMSLVFFIFIFLNKPVASFIPTIGLFAAVAIRLVPSIIRISNSVQSMIFHAPVINNLLEILEEGKKDIKIENLSNEINIEFKNLIEIKNLTYSYPRSKGLVLSNLNLNIKFGDTIGIVGATGVGKSTLINLILGLLEPSSGTILADNKNIYNGIKSWQRQIGYVPQSVYLLDDTIKSNIAFGVPDEKIDDKKIFDAVRKARLSSFFENINLRINNKIGEFGEKVSGGQKQRIGIARAFYNDPKIIILDESTSSLDIETEKQIINEISLLKGKRTILIISHRHSSLAHCEKIYELKNKELKEIRGVNL
jgi:ABC-type multidrug transport system fused ATPase/permease subunit